MIGPCVKCGFDPDAIVGRSWSFFIERRTPSMNDRLANTGPRAFVYRKERDAWCWLFRAKKLELRIPIALCRRRVTLTRLYAGRERERDKDNLIGGLKAVVDAMVSEALLFNDTSIGAEIHYAQMQDRRTGLLVELADFAGVAS